MSDDAFVEDDEHNQRSRKEANVEQLEHRNGIERILHGGEGIAPDDRYRKQQDLPEQRRACAGTARGAAGTQVFAGHRAVGQVFDFVGSVLGHGTSSHSIWAWCPHAYGCVPPHGQIKTGRTGPPARPATVATTGVASQSSIIKCKTGRPRCSDSVYVSELNQFG